MNDIPKIVVAVTVLGLLAISFWAERLAQANPLRFWQSAIACCQKILSRCHLSLDALPMSLIWLSVGMLCIGFLYACSRSIRNLWTTRRFLRYLPRVDSPLKFLPPLPPNVPLNSAEPRWIGAGSAPQERRASLSPSIVIFRDDSIQWAFSIYRPSLSFTPVDCHQWGFITSKRFVWDHILSEELRPLLHKSD